MLTSVHVLMCDAGPKIETVREIMADLEFMNAWAEKIRADILKIEL